VNSTNVLSVTEYERNSLSNEAVTSEPFNPYAWLILNGINDFPSSGLPKGPKVQIEFEEYTFTRLVAELLAFEREFGMSSIELFSQYVNGQLELSEPEEEWLDLFLLFLGTQEIRRFSCP
jgi:hypothetical protein